MYLCVTPEREIKTRRIMEALRAGCGIDAQIVLGPPPNDGEPFVVWGQRWLAQIIIPSAVRRGRPFWHVDNGFWNSARGTAVGTYRITYRGLAPVLLKTPDSARANVDLAPWRTDGEHVLIAMPSVYYGRCIGLDMASWCARIVQRVRKVTGRPMVVRQRASKRPLARDLDGAWCLVTHSSNAAVDAVLAGVPVFVAETSAAAPVGNLDLAQIERPLRPAREQWLASLGCQQFTLEEMAPGVARRWMDTVRSQIDAPV